MELSDESEVSSSTQPTISTITCSNCHTILAKVNQMHLELENHRKHILDQTNAIELLAKSSGTNRILNFAIRDFKGIAVKADDADSINIPDQSSTNKSNGCPSCAALLCQEKMLGVEKSRLRKFILDRTAALETLANLNSDDLLTILIEQLQKIGQNIHHDMDTNDEQNEEPQIKKTKLNSDAAGSLQNIPLCTTSKRISCGSEKESNVESSTSQSRSRSIETTPVKVPCSNSFQTITIPSSPLSCPGSVVKVEPSDEDTGDGFQDKEHHYTVIKYNYPNNFGASAKDNKPSSSSLINKSPFDDSKILYKIINQMDFMDLKTMRLVNRKCQSLASQTLIDRDCCFITLYYDHKSKKYRKSSWIEWESNPKARSPSKFQIAPENLLGNLNDLLGKSIQFPCNSFAFNKGDLYNSDSFNFFNLFGMHIHELHLRCDRKLTSKGAVYNLLKFKIPNIKYLNITNMEYNWTKNEHINLPHLKTLSISQCLKTTVLILDGAPNLTELSDPTGDYNSLVKSGKVNLVKSMHCNEHVNDKPLLKFAYARPSPQLEELMISAQKKFVNFTSLKKLQLTGIFSQLMECSKDHLAHLCLSGLLPCQDVKYPILKEMEYLELDWFPCPNPSPCFPLDINLKQIFPNLTRLDCGSLHCQNDQDWEAHFPQDFESLGKLDTVETLAIPDKCSENWMIRLGKLCPQFKNLEIWADWDLHIILPKVFVFWTSLVQLELKISTLVSAERKKLNLDPPFTGFKNQDCKKFMNAEVNAELEGGRPSLRDLKGLKKLSIVFECSHADLVKLIRNSNSLLVTRVSGELAFKQLPDLKVVIEYDQNCQYSQEIGQAFQSVAPYVNFAHVHDHKNDKISTNRPSKVSSNFGETERKFSCKVESSDIDSE